MPIVSWLSASINVSGTNRPPNEPNRPSWSGPWSLPVERNRHGRAVWPVSVATGVDIGRRSFRGQVRIKWAIITAFSIGGTTLAVFSLARNGSVKGKPRDHS